MILVLTMSLAVVFAQTQPQPPQGERRMFPGDNVAGKVTAVTADSITVAPLAGGNPVTIKITENTRIVKERQPAKLGDIKVDDPVFARGQLSGSTLDAMLVAVVNPDMLQQIQSGGHFNREDLGKKFIAGEVKAINELRLTIARPDNQTQDIEVDENTSFRKGRESVTLADIKVGDFVRGTGELKDGVFVPKELIVGRPNMMMFGGPGRQGAGPGAGDPQKKPDADKPAPPPQ